MTQKKTMTKTEAREWLDGKSTKTCTFRQISEVRSFAKQLGFKVSEYKQRAVMRVHFCTLSMELKEMYWATPDKYSPGYIELSDLLAIEIVEEPRLKCVPGCKPLTGNETIHHADCPYYPESLTKIHNDHRALFEEAVKLLEELYNKRSDDHGFMLRMKIKAFLEANKTIPKSK